MVFGQRFRKKLLKIAKKDSIGISFCGDEDEKKNYQSMYQKIL